MSPYTAPDAAAAASDRSTMNLRSRPEDSAVLLIDWQQRLTAAMPAAIAEANTRNASHLLTLAARLGLPVVATEQYPKGLGPTLEPLSALLDAPPHAKTVFSAMAADAAVEAIRATGRRSWIVLGMETHVCVFQTARDMVEAGFDVQVPQDAVLSRTAANWRNGLDLIGAAGGLVTNTETVLFDLLGEAKGDDFKAVSRLIR